MGLHFPTPTTASQVQGDSTLKEKAWYLDCMPFVFLASIRPRDSQPVSLVRFGQKNLPSAHFTSVDIYIYVYIYIYTQHSPAIGRNIFAAEKFAYSVVSSSGSFGGGRRYEEG